MAGSQSKSVSLTMLRTKTSKLWRCLCGISFVGSKSQVDQHLHELCPVFDEAVRILNTNHANNKSAA